jgi:hypothetical protein
MTRSTFFDKLKKGSKMRTEAENYEWENQYELFKAWLNKQALPAGANKDRIFDYAWDNAFDVDIGDMASCAMGTVYSYIDQKHDYPHLFNLDEGV